MRVVDTSAWIEWLVDSSTGVLIRKHVPPIEAFIVPTIVQLELASWIAREGRGDMHDLIGFTRRCIVIPLDTAIALRAADLRRDTKLATADAIIYATALEAGADLLTCDAHFRDLPGVLFVAKA